MPRLRTSCRLLTVVAALLLGAASAAVASNAGMAKPMDWPHWRGPEMNGISREKGIVEKWSPKGENLLWHKEEYGTRSTPIVMNGKLYTICRDQPETPREGEKVICVDAATGELLWENKWNAFLTDVPKERIGWSSVVGDPTTGNIYAMGVCDYVQCINGETGETIWSHSMSEEYGMLSTYGGRTNFPVIDGDLAIFSGVIIGWGEMAKPAHRFVAFNKHTGEAVWFNGTRLLPDDTTYSSPVIAVINGETQMVFASGDGSLYGFQPQTGKQLWKHDASMRGINVTPLVVGNRIFCGHSEENLDNTTMGDLFAIDIVNNGGKSEAKSAWRIIEGFVGKSSPIYVDGRIYGASDSGTLLIVDAETGKVVSEEKLRGPMRASPLYVDGKIFCVTENGIWWTLEPTEEGVKVVHRARLNIGDVNASPIVSNGRLYVTGSEGLYCVGKEGAEPQADERPAPVEPTPVAEDTKPAQLQVSPVEMLVRPGEKVEYTVRTFNARGQLLETVDTSKVEFSIDSPGEISGGVFSTDASSQLHEGVTVTAKFGDLTGAARVRVVPDLPWAFDFDNGEVPITWVAARYRHIPLDFDLYQELRSANPDAAEMYVYTSTSFINSGRDAVKYEDVGPMEGWTDLLRFFNATQTIFNLDQAKERFEPALQLLKEKEIISEWGWGPPGKMLLTVKRGPRRVEGNGVMTKITTIPKGVRSQAWMGHTDFHDYTVQADVYVTTKLGRLPDVGIIAQRYTLDLMGAAQHLEIRTWHAEERVKKHTPFEWKPDAWYTIKFQASNEDGKAVLRGKVWPRGEDEPTEWLVESIDENPNVTGAPGLFGNAKDGEIFYDNMTMTPNSGQAQSVTDAGSGK